jgi:hypothetical protein
MILRVICRDRWSVDDYSERIDVFEIDVHSRTDHDKDIYKCEGPYHNATIATTYCFSCESVSWK